MQAVLSRTALNGDVPGGILALLAFGLGMSAPAVMATTSDRFNTAVTTLARQRRGQTIPATPADWETSFYTPKEHRGGCDEPWPRLIFPKIIHLTADFEKSSLLPATYPPGFRLIGGSNAANRRFWPSLAPVFAHIVKVLASRATLWTVGLALNR